MKFTTPNNASFIVDRNSDEVRGSAFASDRVLLACVCVLMIFGVLAVYSSIAYFAEAHNTTASNLVFGHMVKLVIAFSVMIIFSKIDYRMVAKFSTIALVLSWVFLIIVTLYGNEVFGARRSLSVAGFSFQPSSLATIALLIHLCVFMVKNKAQITDFKKTFLPAMAWIGVTCFLIGIEDFSSAAVLLVLCLIMMFVGRMSIIQIGSLVLVGLLGLLFLLSQSLERQSRITNYIDQVIKIESSEFALGAGYQAQQAHIAIAKGGILGVGIGKSTQRDFLPAPYNDFIYAIIAEEYGLAGAGLLLFLYVVILFRGIVVVAKNAADELGTLIAMACTLTFVLFGLVNAAVACGLFPVTGLPMPFISYGGTSMLFSGMMIGVLLNISKHKREEEGDDES
ncbi:MAG: FtsW/RodA/SpoVE family cell cycle protein [Balneolales bacterium]|nr:FtsW/RodA/SpoVE family cell cycle protein [Balneolales bacterium]